MATVEELLAEVERLRSEMNTDQSASGAAGIESVPQYDEAKETFEFEFLESSVSSRSYSPVELKRHKFKAFVERQFELRAKGHKDRKAKKDRCAFIIENGKTVMELRYGMAPLKAKGRIVVSPDEQAFKNHLIRAIDKGEFDEALELTAKRDPKKDKKVQKEAEPASPAE